MDALTNVLIVSAPPVPMAPPVSGPPQEGSPGRGSEEDSEDEDRRRRDRRKKRKKRRRDEKERDRHDKVQCHPLHSSDKTFFFHFLKQLENIGVLQVEGLRATMRALAGNCHLQLSRLFALQKRRKKSKYTDLDNVGGRGENWGGGYGGSPPGPYDSPTGGGESDPYDDYYGSPGGGRRGSGGGGTGPRGGTSGGRRGGHHGGGGGGAGSPPGGYDNPYDSPPGPYDSPSDEEGGPPRKKRYERRGFSLVSEIVLRQVVFANHSFGDTHSVSMVARNDGQKRYFCLRSVKT